MFSDVYFPRINGVSTSIHTFRQHLQRFGHRCDVIAPDYPQPFEPEPGIYCSPSRYIFFDPEDRLMRRQQIMQLEDTLKSRDYDLVHIQTLFVAHYAGIELARRLGLPCLTTYHTYFEEYMHHYAPWFPKGLLRLASRRVSSKQHNEADALVVPSRAICELLRSYGVNGNMHIIPTGIDLRAC
jgi:glycosyltransferase involved in cell wall biosynthesis